MKVQNKRTFTSSTLCNPYYDQQNQEKAQYRTGRPFLMKIQLYFTFRAISNSDPLEELQEEACHVYVRDQDYD
jgi:hypothetical protein